VFTKLSSSGVGSVRNLTWTATNGSKRVMDGNDTIGLINNLIAYHYSYYTVK
jgi:hypothetical protein